MSPGSCAYIKSKLKHTRTCAHNKHSADNYWSQNMLKNYAGCIGESTKQI